MSYMDLEKLNKSQIVLLTLLTSFVTSIATGIVTVALIEEAPADVTRVVQRVVEHTVETVSPSDQQATVITQEKTIIVKESDLIAQAVAKNKSRVLSVYNASDVFVSLGTLVSDSGTLVLDDASITADGVYHVRVGEETMLLKLLKKEQGVALFAFAGDAVKTDRVTFVSTAPTLGHTVFTFVGEEALGIAQGIVARITDTALTTDISAGSITPGAPLFTVDGELAGITTVTSREKNPSAFVPAAVIATLLESGATE